MKFAITWANAAFDEMQRLILANPERVEEIRDALRELSETLAADPLGHGESREADRRVGLFGPLVIVYRVIATADRVVVTAVRLRNMTK